MLNGIVIYADGNPIRFVPIGNVPIRAHGIEPKDSLQISKIVQMKWIFIGRLEVITIPKVIAAICLLLLYLTGNILTTNLQITTYKLNVCPPEINIQLIILVIFLP